MYLRPLIPGLAALLIMANGGAIAKEGKQLSREELVAAREAAKQRQTVLKAALPKQNKTHPSKSGILDRSTILCGGGEWTILPKGSILHIPANYQNRVDVEGRGEFVDFKDFLLKNRGWVVTHGVSLEQARGKEAISDQVRKGFVINGRVVVSVFRGGPISTRAFKEQTLAESN